jgi:pyruvate dehydrogenase E1 component beta subunit
VASVEKTNRAVIVEDDWRFGGFGGELSSIIQEQAFDYLDAPVQRVCGADVPMPYNKNLEAAALPQPDDIIDAVMAIR